MKRTLIGLVALVCLLSSCKAGCTIEETVVNGVSGGIVSACGKNANQAAIHASIQGLADKLKICSQPMPSNQSKQGILGMICSGLGDLAVTELANKIPSDWQCDPSTAEQGAEAVITAVCSTIPF